MIKCMKNNYIIKKMIAVVVAAAIMIPLMMPQVFAASTITISSKDEIKGGDTFTVSVTIGGGDVGRVDAQLTYDTDMLSYISGGSSSGNTGYVQLKDAGTSGGIVFNLEFQAVKAGNAILDVSINEIYDLDEQEMETASASKSISIKGNADEAVLITETAEEEEETSDDSAAQDPVVLQGVDEKQEPDITMIAIIVAAVLLLLIIIVSIALKKSKKPKKVKAAAAVSDSEDISDEPVDIDDPESGDRYEENLEGPNPLKDYKNPYEVDKELEEGLKRRREEIRQQRYEQRMAAREYAKAQTQMWDEWTLDDDGRKDSDDIEKW